MVMPGETLGYNESITCTCGKVLPLKVCHTGAGYYLGYWCDWCGPVSRESNYFHFIEDAERTLSLFENNGVVAGSR